MSQKAVRMVHVSWVDSMGTSGWHNNIDADADIRCESVGFLMDKTEKRVKIYMSKNAFQKGDVLEIPTVAVKKIKYLK